MGNDALKGRTFQPYSGPSPRVPDSTWERFKAFFLVPSKRSPQHSTAAAGFLALQVEDKGLRPVHLVWQGEDFAAVGTDWEFKHSSIMKSPGETPLVNDQGTVIGYFVVVDKKRDPKDCRILNVDGKVIAQWWEELPLEDDPLG